MKRFLLLALGTILNITGYAYDFESDGMYFNIISASDRTVSLTYKDENYNTYSGDVVIPGSVIYNDMLFTVENVDYRTFRECSNLKSITLPKGLKNFGTINTDWSVGGFYKTSVWDLYVPDMETFLNLNIAQWANPFNSNGSLFVNGELLVDAIVPEGIQKIRFDCFVGCQSLKTIKFSSSVQVIESQAFADCTNLEKVQLNDEITEIGVNAFWECTNLKEINIPQNVRLLGDGGNGYVFYNCTSLESPMIFPEGLETIPTGMFSGCKSLKEVVFPSTINKIYWHTFNGCISLQSITCNAITPPLCYEAEPGGSTIFEGVDKFTCTIKVPEGTKDLYSQAESWKQFFNIVEGNEPDNPILSKCSIPTISYDNGKLTFTCNTEGAECVATISDADIKTHYGNEISLTATYNVSVYATATGYENSDVATATLCWLDAEPKTEGMASNIATARGNAVLIQSHDGILRISGVENDTSINVYTSAGVMVGMAKASGETTSIASGLRNGDIAIIKIGEKSVKVVVR